MEKWHLSELWIGEVARECHRVWRDNPSIDRWELPFLVDRAFRNEEEFRAHAWNPLAQPSVDYKAEVLWKLHRYIEFVETEARRSGLKPATRMRDRGHDHFLWLVQFQIKRQSYYKISQHQSFSDDAVVLAVKKLALELPLGLRSGR
jgi:hypothetical protein